MHSANHLLMKFCPKYGGHWQWVDYYQFRKKKCSWLTVAKIDLRPTSIRTDLILRSNSCLGSQDTNVAREIISFFGFLLHTFQQHN